MKHFKSIFQCLGTSPVAATSIAHKTHNALAILCTRHSFPVSGSLRDISIVWEGWVSLSGILRRYMLEMSCFCVMGSYLHKMSYAHFTADKHGRHLEIICPPKPESDRPLAVSAQRTTSSLLGRFMHSSAVGFRNRGVASEYNGSCRG